MFVTISENIFNVNELHLFWTLGAELLCRCFGLWWESQKPGLCWVASSCHGPRAVCHFRWGRCLLWVAIFPGEISKQTRIWGTFYPVFLCLLCQVSVLRRMVYFASSTSCQSLACLLPSWHLLLTEPWHVLAFDELVLKVQVHLSFFSVWKRV